MVTTDMRAKLCIIMTCLIVLFCFTEASAKTMNLRNKRYCEVIFSNGYHLEVYNTIGLNDCPESIWKNITVKDIKKETGAFFVYLNGPRKFIVDDVVQTRFIDPDIKTFHHLQMRKTGVLEMSVRDIVFGSGTYQKHSVHRHNTWVYAPGKRVYELIAPNGEVYLMQSYALSAKQHSEKDLMDLNTRIKLEKGWQYKTGILSKRQTLPAIDGEAIVIRDNEGNAYQQATHDFL
ncbi:MAG TPA: hypothetical protein VHD33_04960 [Legionellaceae bacterium]|nr:hypothetical protein [Legionellaceae bacterium]